MLRALNLIILLFFMTYAEACNFEKVTFEGNFEGARINECKKLENGIFEIITNPENQPINPSPWYAFKVKSKSEQEQITVSIRAKDARPRYMPKTSSDRENWQQIPFQILDGSLRFKLNVSQQPIFVAAQPLLTAADYEEWLRSNLIAERYEKFVIGKSVQGRDLHALLHKRPENKEWFLIVGRQHPPELTGAFAAVDFINAISRQTSLSKQFFDRFNILIVPFLNPDGVAGGNWRHNANGIDLNRDWGKFTQPETGAVGKYIDENIIPNGNIVFALDFHSTQQDIFYTMPTDYGLVPASFSEHWIDSLRENRLSSFTIRERPGSSPGRGVFKQYIADNFGVHSVTYEMGDNTPRDMISHIANVSAETLMTQLLNTDSEAFIGGRAKAEVELQ